MATDRQNLYAEKTLIQNTHLLALKGENPLFLHTPQFPGEGAAVYTQIVGQFAPPHVQMEFAAGLDREHLEIKLDPVAEPVLGQDPHFLIEKKGAPPHFTEQVGGDLGFVRASAFLLKKQRVKIQIEHLHIGQRVDLDGTVLRHGAHQSLPKYLPPPPAVRW